MKISHDLTFFLKMNSKHFVLPLYSNVFSDDMNEIKFLFECPTFHFYLHFFKPNEEINQILFQSNFTIDKGKKSFCSFDKKIHACLLSLPPPYN